MANRWAEAFSGLGRELLEGIRDSFRKWMMRHLKNELLVLKMQLLRCWFPKVNSISVYIL